MYLQVKRISVEKEYIEQFTEKWLKRNQAIEGLEQVLVFVDDKDKSDIREIMIQLHWESREKCLAWKVHPDHIAGHKKAGKRPEWVIKSESKGYTLCQK